MSMLVAIAATSALVAIPAKAESACPNAAFRQGRSEALPDCRTYEQVTALPKAGYDLGGTFSRTPGQASPSGESVAYFTLGAALGESTSNVLFDAYVASRTTAGWRTTNVTPPSPQVTPDNLIGNSGYGFDFSPTLSEFVAKVPFQSLASAPDEVAPARVNNLFLRDANNSYTLITPSHPPELPEEHAREEGRSCPECFDNFDIPTFMGANSGTVGVPAFTHILFEENESLEGIGLIEPLEPLIENLYESDMSEPASRRVRFVGVLPDRRYAQKGSVAGAGLSVRYVNPLARSAPAQAVAHAISSDGSQILFQAASDEGALPEEAGQKEMRELYDRIDGTTTIEVSSPAAGATPANPAAEPASFASASEDGSQVLFTSTAELTSQSNTGPANEGNDLYLFNVSTRQLTDLTVDPEGSGADVLGVVGASAEDPYRAPPAGEQGGYVYFVADGQLNGEGKAGEPNLYVAHDGGVKLIATLSASDELDWTAQASQAEAYVTPDGRHLAFTSIEPVTGYDNSDLNEPGRLDREVFEYSAEAGALVCASCDPNGARPIAEASLTAQPTPFYHPRVLSDDGSRLFFSVGDSETGGLGPGEYGDLIAGKLFEYESGRAHLLASSAQFLDASASGGNVFFITREQLAPTDTDENLDVYDAGEDGEPQSPSVPATPCSAGTCRSSYEASPAPSTPASVSLLGDGNVPGPPPQTSALSRPSRAELLSRALKKCKKDKQRRKRVACERAARTRYGVSTSAKGNAQHG